MKYFFFLLPLISSFQFAYAEALTFDNLVGTYVPISKEITSDQNPEACGRFQSYRSQIINLKIEKDNKTNQFLGQSHVVYIRQKEWISILPIVNFKDDFAYGVTASEENSVQNNWVIPSIYSGTNLIGGSSLSISIQKNAANYILTLQEEVVHDSNRIALCNFKVEIQKEK